MQHGSGSITIGGGVAKSRGSPRLYISNSDRWENVEMSAYGKWVERGTLKSFSGFTMAARSNHDNYRGNGCDAFGYYARIHWQSGRLAFTKEYFHGSDGVVYTTANEIDYFAGEVPMNQWIGMRFTVETKPDDEVELKLYLDEVGDGSWVLRHSMIDRPGEWEASRSVPSDCPQESSDPVLRPGHVCFLRSDGSNQTEMHWKHAIIREL